MDFQIAQYGPACQTLLTDLPPGELGPGQPDPTRREQLEELTSASLFAGRTIADPQMAACCRAGLWLLHNYLDESHRISQEIHTPTGSYWHGIMHRREPDFSNAKYWFRKVGEHPVFGALGARAGELATGHATERNDPATTFLTRQAAWNPAAFVDLCEAVTRGRSESVVLCQEIAVAEWQLLFDHCFHAALGQ